MAQTFQFQVQVSDAEASAFAALTPQRRAMFVGLRLVTHLAPNLGQATADDVAALDSILTQQEQQIAQILLAAIAQQGGH
jgi:hypothetical protein